MSKNKANYFSCSTLILIIYLGVGESTCRLIITHRNILEYSMPHALCHTKTKTEMIEAKKDISKWNAVLYDSKEDTL